MSIDTVEQASLQSSFHQLGLQFALKMAAIFSVTFKHAIIELLGQ